MSELLPEKKKRFCSIHNVIDYACQSCQKDCSKIIGESRAEVERLEKEIKFRDESGESLLVKVAQAQEERDRLAAENKRMREALIPFADWFGHKPNASGDELYVYRDGTKHCFKYSDCVKAKKALSPEPSSESEGK